jgi:FkbH-like protein
VVLLDPRADLRQTNEQRLRRTLAGLAGVTVAPVAALARALGADFSQTRLANRTAGWLSDQAMIALARALACQWLPPLIEPRFKVLALDLDNTLYLGALGEEGAARLRLTTAHRRLQQQLIRLAQSGVLLTLVSKNKPTDVATLWTERSDFPLHREHFVATAIGWQPKSQLLAELAAELHLGLEAFILVDDNPGELAAVAAGTPCATLWAGDPVLTQQTLRYFPGLVGYRPDENALVRAQDLIVQNQRRALVTQSHDLLDYLSSLKVCLTLAFKPHAQVARIHELSGKTNQFNTALARLSEAAVAQRLVDPNFVTISIALRDRLADAGVIGVLQAHGENHCVVVDELLISCRALGRGVEDAIAGEALLRAATYFKATKIHFTLVEGPRNEPARSWVNDLCDTQNEVAVTTVMARVAKLRPALSIGWQGES